MILSSIRELYLRIKNFPNKEAQTGMKTLIGSTTLKSKFWHGFKIWYSYVQQFVGGK
jgi:hypothetical protein